MIERSILEAKQRAVEGSKQELQVNALKAVLDAIKADGFQDVPLTTTLEAQTLPTPEQQVEIKRFSQEQREALEKQGFVIYGLTGKSIKTLKDSGRKFWSTWHNEYPDFERLASMQSEIAINPSKLFLPKSNNKTLTEQEKMVEKFSQNLGKKIEGVKAVVGEAPDYIELAFQHLDATKEYLFGEKYKYNYARTKTLTSSSLVALVGYFHAVYGLRVYHWDADHGSDYVYAAPLAVPA